MTARGTDVWQQLAELRHSRKTEFDPQEPFGYEFKLPETCHWQSRAMAPLLIFRPFCIGHIVRGLFFILNIARL